MQFIYLADLLVMKNYLLSIYFCCKKNTCFIFLSIVFLCSTAFGKTTDLGVCFLKAQDKTTLQSKINEIAYTPQDNVKIQHSARFFNDLTNLFVPIDTFNYKLFWVSKPNNEWLTQNCFKFGYITLMDYNRRAITRVYSNPNFQQEFQVAKNSRFPASTKDAIPKADPENQNPIQAIDANLNTPFDPNQNAESQSPLLNSISPLSPQSQMQPQSSPQTPPNYSSPQINLYNYYGTPQQQMAQDNAKSAKEDSKDDNLNVNVNVGDKDEKKPLDEQKEIEKSKYKKERTGSVYDVPSYLEEPSNFFELIPNMGYENVSVIGGGNEDKFNMFSYGIDMKVGYRFNQYFNWYIKGNYSLLEVRSVEAPAVVTMNTSSEYSYGLGVEHVASRFLSLAIEYVALHYQGFNQVAPDDVQSFTNDFQTINLDFKINFISRDDFKFGLAGNYGATVVGNSSEVNFDLKSNLFVMRTFEKGHFGLNIGLERNAFNFTNLPTEQVIRNRYVLGLNYGFDL